MSLTVEVPVEVTVEDKITRVIDPKQFTLRIADRGDCCGSQAYFQIELLSGGVLLMCRKHYLFHEKVLLPQAKSVIDESIKLYPNRLIGSEN